MIRIVNLKVLSNKKIKFEFSDGIEKIIDFTPFIGKDDLSKPLLVPAYFQNVKLYENGRGIYWPNGFDFCPDFLRQYHSEEKREAVEKV